MSNRQANQMKPWRKMFRLTAGYGMLCCILFCIAGCGMLDEPIEKRIESVGSQLFGVDVEVDGFHMRVAGGMAEITGFTVANPGGHSADYAVQLELLRLNLGIASTLGGNAILIEEFVIDGPRVNFEQIKPESSNLKELGDNAHKNREATEQQDDEASGEPVRISVGRLLIKDVEYSIRLADGRSRSKILPTIELHNIGVPEGKTPAGLGMVVLLSMTREIFLDLAAEKLRERVAGCQLQLEVLDTEQILLAVEEKLGLSRKQLEQIRPVIEEQSQALHQAIDELRDRGFLNLESLPEAFRGIAERAKKQLATQLTAEQLAAIETVYQQLQQTSKEEIMNALAAHLARVLEIKKEQLAAVLLILRDEIEQRHKLLARLTHEPERSVSDVIEELKVIQEQTRSRLEPLLTPASMERLTNRQGQLLSLIQEAYFGIVVPLNSQREGTQ